jgi:hypothetical protein
VTGRRVIVATAMAAGFVFGLGAAAVAETYDVLGNQVGTNGSDADDNSVTGVAAVSQGGCSTAFLVAASVGEPNHACNIQYDGVSDTHGGVLAVGLLGADSRGMVAVSDTGTAHGDCFYIGLGCVEPGFAVSGTGHAHGENAVSGTGNASANTDWCSELYPLPGCVEQYGGVAASGTGSSQSDHVAVAGGSAHGGEAGVGVQGDASGDVAVTVFGDADGETAAFSVFGDAG